MRIVFGVIFITGFWGGYALALPVANHHIVSRNFEPSADEMYSSYVAIPDRINRNKIVNLMSQVEKIFLNQMKNQKIQYHAVYSAADPRSRRNTRSTSYLTLCHFKICNMGGKRAPRYYHANKRPEDHA